LMIISRIQICGQRLPIALHYTNGFLQSAALHRWDVPTDINISDMI